MSLTVALLGMLAPSLDDLQAADRTPPDEPSRLLRQKDFVYRGAFRLPRGKIGESRFGWGGSALTFNANDPNDHRDDSLFLVGHDHHQMVAEVTIPTPVISYDLGALPKAKVLQPFADPTNGLMWRQLEGKVKIGGLLVYGDRLIWTAYEYYDADTDARYSHGTASLDLSASGNAQGMYRVGQKNPGFTAGYMAHVPKEWQAQLGAPALTGQSTGVLAIVSRTSAGPALFGFNPAALRTRLVPAQPLVYYERTRAGARELGSGLNTRNRIFNFNSSIGGVVFPVGARSVVFFGGHGTGKVCYGPAKDCQDPIRGGKGHHDVGGNYIYQAWAYDVKDLVSVRKGSRHPWQVLPYDVWEVEFPIPHSDARILGVAYDAHTNRVFLSQYKGDFPNNRAPLIHVFEIARAPTEKN